MASVNKVILVGHCGKDPEIRYLNNEKAVTNLSLATTEKYKDKSGQTVEVTEWHRLALFGKLAEIADEYVKKGSLIYVEGKIKTEKWTDDNGIERYATKIICDRMQMLGGKQQETSPQQASANKDYGKATGRSSRQSEPTPIHELDDDIPF